MAGRLLSVVSRGHRLSQQFFVDTWESGQALSEGTALLDLDSTRESSEGEMFDLESEPTVPTAGHSCSPNGLFPFQAHVLPSGHNQMAQQVFLYQDDQLS